MKELIDVLNNISQEQNSIKRGQIWKRNDRSLGGIIPILSEASQPRDYVMLQEAEKEGKAKVEDTGKIDGAKIENKGDKPVFVRSASILKGNTQERAAVHSNVVEPEKTVEVEVVCVHQSKPIQSGAKMEYSGHVAPRMVSASLKRGQSATWSSAQNYSMSMASSYSGRHRSGGWSDALTAAAQNVKSDDLFSNLEFAKSKGGFDKVLGTVECMENQIGIIVFDENGIAGIELFDHPDSWKSFHQTVVSSYSDVLTKETSSNLFTLNPTAIKTELDTFIQKCRKCSFKMYGETKTSQSFSMENGTLQGEYTLMNSKLMHLLILRTDEEKEPPKKTGSSLFDQPRPRTFEYITPTNIASDIYDNLRHRNTYKQYGALEYKQPAETISFLSKTSKMGKRNIVNVPHIYSSGMSKNQIVKVSYDPIGWKPTTPKIYMKKKR